MIDDPEHPEMKAAANYLARYLHQAMVGRTLDGNAMVFLNNTVTKFRRTCRSQGLDFPMMSVLVVPSIRYLQLVRADLSQSSINTLLENCTKQWPKVPVAEWRKAFSRAFPDASPTGFAIFNQ